jgi:hypothetical protein
MDRVVYQRVAVPMDGSQPIMERLRVTWHVPTEQFDQILQWVNDNLELTVPSKLRMVPSSAPGGGRFRALDFWVDGEHKVHCLEAISKQAGAMVNVDVH